MGDENTQQANALELSDEDFLNADPSQFEGPVAVEDASTRTPEEIEEERRAALTDEERAAEDAQNNDDPGDGPTPEELEEERRAALTPEQREAEDAGVGGDDSGTQTAEEIEAARREALTDEERAAEDAAEAGDKKEKSADKSDDAKFADIGRQVMAEFKANGTTMKMKSAEDVIQLMQMGANYHKKMSGLKPSLKTLKLLENNGLLEPGKIDFLIDLHNQKPEAITQLLKDSKIDPMAIDVEGAENYTPNQHTVSDKELALDEVLESISNSPNRDKTLNVIGNDWDDASRQTIATNPEIIQVINAHMDNGIYDQIVETVAYDRSLGKLQGISDFEAYQRVGAHMHENRMFRATEGDQTSDSDNRQDTQSPGQEPSATDQEEAERIRRKKAASPSRRNTQQKEGGKKEFNPLEMSDEEFMKINKLSL